MSEYLFMNGYGTYIWSAYGIAFLILGLLLFFSWRFLKSTETEIKRLQLPKNQQRERDVNETKI